MDDLIRMAAVMVATRGTIEVPLWAENQHGGHRPPIEECERTHRRSPVDGGAKLHLDGARLGAIVGGFF